jgi:transcriptional regulator with XRE-family HTH domain
MTPPAEESPREIREALERQEPPRDEEEAAAYKGMDRAVTALREERGMSVEELASRSGVPPAELQRIEGGEFAERWGDLGRIAKALETTLPALISKAEELAPGPGGEAWRESSRQASKAKKAK